MGCRSRKIGLGILCFVVAAFVFASSSVHAYLGGFEAPDGYVDVNSHLKPTGTPPPFPDYDVAKYNAGQYGANVNPTASYSQANPASRLWTKDVTLSPLMPSRTDSGSNSPRVVYATSHSPTAGPPAVVPHSGGRVFLVTTNNQDFGNAVWTGNPQAYAYKIDTHDLDGMNPALTGNQKLQISFWSCAQLYGVGEGGGLPAGTIGNTVSFRDSTGAPAFTVGYSQPTTTSPGDVAWTSLGGNTNIAIDNLKWHRWDISLDLVTDTVSVQFTPELVHATGSTPAVLGAPVQILSSVPLPTPMNSLTSLEFTSTAGINNAKYWALDDFDFCITEAPLSDLLSGGSLWSGDKQFSDFSYHGGGDMPAAEDIYVKAITDAIGNFGIRYQGAFVDAVGGGASDALIDFKVTAPEGKLIKDVHMAANPLVIGGDDGLVAITETFLPDNDQTVLSVYDIPGGERKLTDWADLVDENGELAPVQELHVQKDILVWSQQTGTAATLSFFDQTFSQCDDLNGDGACDVVDPIPTTLGSADLDLDGDVDGEDMAMWEAAFGGGQLGDADGDGDSDGGDFLAWQRQTGGSVLALPAAASTVPEPASIAVLASLLTIAAGCRIGRRAV